MDAQDTAIQTRHNNKGINWVRFETRRTSGMVISCGIDTFLTRLVSQRPEVDLLDRSISSKYRFISKLLFLIELAVMWIKFAFVACQFSARKEQFR